MADTLFLDIAVRVEIDPDRARPNAIQQVLDRISDAPKYIEGVTVRWTELTGSDLKGVPRCHE